MDIYFATLSRMKSELNERFILSCTIHTRYWSQRQGINKRSTAKRESSSRGFTVSFLDKKTKSHIPISRTGNSPSPTPFRNNNPIQRYTLLRSNVSLFHISIYDTTRVLQEDREGPRKITGHGAMTRVNLPGIGNAARLQRDKSARPTGRANEPCLSRDQSSLSVSLFANERER